MKKWLILVLLLGLALRIFKLADTPYPLNGDEKAFGYYSWSLLHFGTDEYGTRFPLYFPSIGDYKYPGLAYFSIPFTLALDIGEFQTRLPSALAGLSMVLICFLFAKHLFKNDSIALASAFIAAVSPWSITFSRTATESNLATALTLAGFLFFLYFEKSKSTKYLVISFLFFITSFLTYSSSRVFIPAVFFLLIIMAFFHNLSGRKIYILMFVFTSLISLLLLQDPRSRARAENLSILKSPETRTTWINDYSRIMGLGDIYPTAVTRLFFNKPVSVIYEYVSRYLSHFSPEYLFISGDRVKLNAIHNFGNLYIFESVFFIFGLVYLAKNRSHPILLCMLLASPVASAGSIETPSAVRQIIGSPSFYMITGLGLFSLLIKKNIFINLFIASLYLYFVMFLIISLVKIKPYFQPWTTDQSNKELFTFIWNNKQNYKKVIMNSGSYIDYLFYNKVNPLEFAQKSTIVPEQVGVWQRVVSIDNIFLKMNTDCPKIGQLNALYICSGADIPRSAQVVRVFRYKDSLPKYVAVTFQALPPEKQARSILPTDVHYHKEGDSRYPLGIFEDDPNRYY